MARTSKRKDNSLVTEAGVAQDHGGDDRYFVAFENVGGHSGAVADVVADVVGDGRGITGVIFGNSRFNFADQVGSHVGCLGVNAAADSHEECQQGSAKAEAEKDLIGMFAVRHEDDCSTQKPKAVGEHPGIVPVR